jgi:hypothetical protein
MTNLRRQPSLPHRLTAVFGVVLVVVLIVLAASPGLHAWVHHHDGPAAGCHADAPLPVAGGEHHCAVTLFAGGVEALQFVSLPPLLPPAYRAMLRPTDLPWVALPRYWHRPAIGPPLL